MRFDNEGDWDRAGRIFGGILLLTAGWTGFASGTLGVVLMGVGLVALATGIVGWCPAYSVFGFSTKKAAAGRARSA
jgi:hypothetical protein